MRFSKLISLKLCLCLMMGSWHIAGFPGSGDFLAPVSRVLSEYNCYTFHPLGEISPQVRQAQQRLSTQTPFSLLLQSLKQHNSGFKCLPEEEVEDEVWSGFRSIKRFRNNVEIELDLNTTQQSGILFLTKHVHGREGNRPAFGVGLKGNLPTGLYFVELDYQKEELRLYFQDRIWILKNNFSLYNVPLDAKDSVVTKFKGQMFDAGKHFWLDRTHRHWFVGDLGDPHRYLVVEGREGEILGIFYRDKETAQFEAILIPSGLTIPGVRYLLTPFSSRKWLFLETWEGIKRFFFQAFPVSLPSEQQIFEKSGMDLIEQGNWIEKVPANVYWRHGLQILVYYLFPGLKLRLFYGHTDWIRVADLESLRALPEEKCLEVVTYANELEKNPQRTPQQAIQNRIIARYYEDTACAWKLDYRNPEMFFQWISARDPKELLVNALRQCVAIPDTRNFWFLGQPNGIEFVVFMLDENLRVWDRDGNEVCSVPGELRRRLFRREGRWVLETDANEYDLFYRGRKAIVTGKRKPVAAVPIAGLNSERWPEGKKPLGYNTPLWVYTSPTGRTVLYDCGLAYDVFGLKEDGSIRFTIKLSKTSSPIISFDPQGKVLKIQRIFPEGTQIQEIDENGFFKHRLVHASSLLEVLKIIAQKMSPPCPLEEEPEITVARSLPDEMKLGLRDRIQELLDQGVRPEQMTFCGIYRSPGEHLCTDLTALWGDVQLVVVETHGGTLMLDGHGNEVRNPAALFPGLFPGETSL